MFWPTVGATAVYDAFLRHGGSFTPVALWRDSYLRRTVIVYLLIGLIANVVVPAFDPAHLPHPDPDA